ncbi:hypothetical protein KJ836_03625 [Patescibacteria group bacterium]|nr:hypothetical protein [Patescibacteria group bacterium]
MVEYKITPVGTLTERRKSMVVSKSEDKNSLLDLDLSQCEIKKWFKVVLCENYPHTTHISTVGYVGDEITAQSYGKKIVEGLKGQLVGTQTYMLEPIIVLVAPHDKVYFIQGSVGPVVKENNLEVTTKQVIRGMFMFMD